MPLSKLVAHKYAVDEVAWDECVLPDGSQLWAFAYWYPAGSRNNESMATIGWLDYENAAVVREMTQGEG